MEVYEDECGWNFDDLFGFSCCEGFYCEDVVFLEDVGVGFFVDIGYVDVCVEFVVFNFVVV